MSRRSKAVAVVAVSENRKTGPVSATWASQSTCPSSCPFMGDGCYAETGPSGTVTRRLNRSKVRSVVRLAQEEADGIDSLPADRDLRLHVVGDCTTEAATEIVAEACRRYLDRHDHRVSQGMAESGAMVWGYTHAWRDVPAAAWGVVSILASVERPADARAAMEAGYAVAIVVAEHPFEKTYSHHGITVIPCPYETRGVQCVDCRLCMDAPRLLEKGVCIGFAAHGAKRMSVKASLTVLNGEQ